VAFGWVGLFTAILSAAPSPADRPDTAALARQAWAVTDLVLANHLAPPARTDMLLAGVRALLSQSGVKPPADLRDRLANVANAEQLAAVLENICPNVNSSAEVQNSLLQGLLPEDGQERLFTILGLPPRMVGLPAAGDRLVRAADLRIQEQLTQNRYVGTGIQIRRHAESDYVMIVLPYAGGPARRAGARSRDLIVEVDGVNMKGKTTAEMVTALRGNEGTDVTMVVRQPDADETRTLKMTRAVVPFDTALGYRRTGEQSWQYRPDPAQPIAYVRLESVKVSTLHDLRRVERQLQADGAKALVLDLRECADVGELAHAALVADGLLDGGLMWRVRGPRDQVKDQHADRDCLFRGWPMALLVNDTTQGTGCLAVAAALQDNHRVVVVGQPTPWAGLVRSLFPLPDSQAAMILTTGVLERPASAREPADTARRLWGLQPDHVVPVHREKSLAIMTWQRQQESPDAPTSNAQPPDDAQLAKALELLQAALNGSDRPGSPRQGRGQP
jgi:carboxyl-terminal processing protease